jgi:hypothetical protein
MTIGILKEWLVKYFFVHKNVFKAIMILKEFCSSKINALVMKTFSGK